MMERQDLQAASFPIGEILMPERLETYSAPSGGSVIPLGP
jgi:hypothetical protein